VRRRDAGVEARTGAVAGTELALRPGLISSSIIADLVPSDGWRPCGCSRHARPPGPSDCGQAAFAISPLRPAATGLAPLRAVPPGASPRALVRPCPCRILALNMLDSKQESGNLCAVSRFFGQIATDRLRRRGHRCLDAAVDPARGRPWFYIDRVQTDYSAIAASTRHGDERRPGQLRWYPARADSATQQRPVEYREFLDCGHSGAQHIA